MRIIFVLVFFILLAFYSFAPTTSKAFPPGATTVVFHQTSSALTSTANVVICQMNQGLPQSTSANVSNPGNGLQAYTCDSITGYFLGKTLTVNLTGASYFVIENLGSGAIQYNHTGGFPTSNALSIPSNGFWSEAIR
jgi:hypothetical protein